MKKLLSILVLALLLVGLPACDAIDTDVLPATDNTYDVGSEDLAWAEGWFGNLYIDGAPVGGGSGDVVGPDGATDHGLVRYDGVSGKLIEDSLGTLLDDDANLFIGGDISITDVNAGGIIYADGGPTGLDVLYSAEIGAHLIVGNDITVGGTTTLNDQIDLVGDGKVWIELRPELDFDIIKKNAVPVSYERGIFTGFELPIYAADDQELFFEICVPDRWDGISITHVHLDVFLIGAQDAGDAFRMQVDYEHYDGGVDVVPATSTPIEVETETGALAAFQSYHIHFDIPAGDMLGDDILAFRVRRIAVVDGIEIDGNVVFNHAGVIFLFDKIGNTTAE